jgi:hypothetical protein
VAVGVGVGQSPPPQRRTGLGLVLPAPCMRSTLHEKCCRKLESGGRVGTCDQLSAHQLPQPALGSAMSAVDRAFNGFLLGGSIGVAAGSIFGTMQALGSGCGHPTINCIVLLHTNERMERIWWMMACSCAHTARVRPGTHKLSRALCQESPLHRSPTRGHGAEAARTLRD